MSGGLVALLDDVAALAKVAAASVDDIGAAAGRAGAKAVGVVVDDTAVTPNYVRDFAAERELPMIKKIAIGSLRNKLLLILPVAMLLSQFLPQAMPWLLMVGGAFLCYEGAEKVLGLFGVGGHHDKAADAGAPEPGTAEHEKMMVSGAIRTDLILSAEIMAISLAEVSDQPFLSRLLILIVVALAITILVYGVVALIVKMDDIGLKLAQQRSEFSQKVGTGLVKAMPKVMTVLGVVGTAAMLWVGGHILLVNSAEVGLPAPYELVHHVEEWVHHATGALGGVFGWFTNTLASAIIGLAVGAAVVAVKLAVPTRKKAGTAAAH